MTIQELQKLAKNNPDKLIYLKIVADLCGMTYHNLKQTYVYSRPIIEVVQLNGKKGPKSKLYCTAKEAWDFVPAYLKFNS